MSDCEYSNEFKYCNVEGIFMLGDNSTNVKNALKDDAKCPELVEIPVSVNGRKVEEIGYKAFEECNNIKEIRIYARITRINSHAFWECSSLERIYLPSTLQYIYDSGIHTYNSSVGNEIPNPGLTEVIFQKNSHLKFIGSQGISYRENMHIYICEEISPEFDKKPFNWAKNVRIFSPYSFHFYEYDTIVTPYLSFCINPLTCHSDFPPIRNCLMIYLSIFIFCSF